MHVSVCVFAQVWSCVEGHGLVSVRVLVCCVSGLSVEPCWSVGHPFDAEAPLRGEGDQRTCVRLGSQQQF